MIRRTHYKRMPYRANNIVVVHHGRRIHSQKTTDANTGFPTYMEFLTADAYGGLGDPQIGQLDMWLPTDPH